MFTLVLKLWFIITLSGMIFVGGMVYANSSDVAPFAAPSVQNFGPSRQSANASTKASVKNTNAPKTGILKDVGKFFSDSKKSTMGTVSGKTSHSASLKLNAGTAPTPYRGPKTLATLKSSHWIEVSTGLGACSMKPEEHWSFAKTRGQEGFECTKVSAVGGDPVYRCGPKNTKRSKDYIVKIGSPTLGMAFSDRPYITLERVNRPSQRMGLKQCSSADQTWSPNTSLAKNNKKTG